MMGFNGEVARLRKVTREVLLREVLREVQGDDAAVVDQIDIWRRFRNLTFEQMEHYATAEVCSCLVCSLIAMVARVQLPSRSATRTGELWVTDMIALLDKHAPGLTPAKLRQFLAFERLLKSRTEDELWHFARNGFFLSHTLEQAEEERRFLRRFCRREVHREMANADDEGLLDCEAQTERG
jgi:hypothetical protein